MKFGLLFRCSPFEVLDRPSQELPVVLAMIEVGSDMIEEANNARSR